MSDLFVERIDAYLGYPDKDPHGEAIPDAKGFRNEELDICLLRAEPGEYIVRKVTNDQPEFLAYLAKQALTPGAAFMLLEKAPFQGPLKLVLAGRKAPQYLGVEAARNIHVLPSGPPAIKQHPRSSHASQTIAFQGSSVPTKVAEASGRRRKPLRGSSRRPR